MPPPSPGPSVGPSVCVVGGGLAGLAAAITAADAGAVVTLLESRARLGGATFSFVRDGLSIDNGQHVFLRCCTAYRVFLDRLGVADRVWMQDRLSLPVVTPGGRIHHLSRGRGPAPLHLAGSLSRYPLLTAADKLAAARAVLGLRRIDPEDSRADDMSFGRWLRRTGQSERAIDALWGLLSIPTMNVAPDNASLGLAAMVFRTGLLQDSAAGDIGMPAVPLSQLHAEPARAVLDAAGADVRTSARVTAIERRDDRLLVRTHTGDVPADAVVVAVPHDDVAAILPEGAVANPTALRGLGASPIVNLHVIYDRRVTDQRFAVGHASPVQWVFDRSEVAGLSPGDGQYLVVSLSAADSYLHLPVAALRERFLPALAELFPAARAAHLRSFLVTREPQATFRAAPGTARLRLGECTAVPGVLLAGSWTDTGWPATMEGAVRSGVRAARRALCVERVSQSREVDAAAADRPSMEGAMST